jgi:hypothetical protein
MKPAALFLFHLNPTMAAPWAEAGYDCYLVDLQHPRGERRDGNLIYVGADIHRWTPPLRRYHFGFACPPCTDVAVSGARWFAGKGLYALADAIANFARAAEILEAADCPYGVENPVSVVSSHWRKPDYTFDPCDYAGYPGGEGDTYTKKTCIWGGGGFVMPPPRRLDPVDGSRMHLLPPSSERANLRSATPPGFAYATFLANRVALEAAA